MPHEDQERTIRLVGVSRDLVDEKFGRRCVLRGVHADIIANGNISIVGQEPALLTSFLHLVAGSEVPDHGRVASGGIRFSPVINAAGLPASNFMPQLSGIENIQFFARLHGMHAAALVEMVDEAAQLGSQLKKPVRNIEAVERRRLEAALFAALPYECYLVDRMDMLRPEFRWLIAHSVKARAASMIFATDEIKLAKQFGHAGFTIDDGRLKRQPGLRLGFRQTHANIR